MPIQSGSGMQFEILEAMACGLPVVTTQLGLGDVHAEPNKEIILADSPIAFARSVIEMFGSESLASCVGDNGCNYVQSNHNLGVINQKFATKCNLHCR